jgi:hypothetical protein
MIQLIFAYNREVLNFLVKDREIFYTDRKWKAWIRCLPPPEDLIKQIKLSRNKIPAFISELFKFSDEDLKEYESAKSERELADLIIRDARVKGCKIIQDREVKDGDVR